MNKIQFTSFFPIMFSFSCCVSVLPTIINLYPTVRGFCVQNPLCDSGLNTFQLKSFQNIEPFLMKVQSLRNVMGSTIPYFLNFGSSTVLRMQSFLFTVDRYVKVCNRHVCAPSTRVLRVMNNVLCLLQECVQFLSCARTILELVRLQARSRAPKDGTFILLWKREYEIFLSGPVPYILIGLEAESI